MQIDAIIAEVRSAHRERCYAMEQRKRADLALLSFLRVQAGWRRDLPDAERKAIAERAKAFVDGAEDEGLAQWRPVVDASVKAREPFDEIEAAALKEMGRLAEQLPAWEHFGEPIRGFGPASLAVIVGEAGDLSIYSNPAKLWKRMGVGIVDGIRQGGLAKNASKEDWIAHGYNRQRRSRMWNIGDAIIKGNRDGEYRTLYLQRKEYEIARNPEMTPMQAHRRAQRYMEKRLLRNLWAAWRQTKTEAKPDVTPSAADNSEQQANVHASTTQHMPAGATGQPSLGTQSTSAGRSNSNRETIAESQPTEGASPKRRTRVQPKPNASASGAPIRQASQCAQPMSLLPADATRDPPAGATHPRVVSRRDLSRANGTGGHPGSETQSRRAAR
jgi:hypothetical protein